MGMNIREPAPRGFGIVLVIIAMFAGAGVSCANRNGPNSAAPEAAPAVQPELAAYETVRISLERTACYGTCPIYTLSIDQDGRVEYDGKRFVRVEGRQRGQIRPEQVRELVALFFEVDFFAMQGRYDQLQGPGGVKMTVSDLPTTITTIAIDERSKRVENYVGGPEELRRLEAAIDRISGAEEWIRESQENR